MPRLGFTLAYYHAGLQINKTCVFAHLLLPEEQHHMTREGVLFTVVVFKSRCLVRSRDTKDGHETNLSSCAGF